MTDQKMVSVACNFGDILSLGRSRKLAKSGGLALQDDGIRASWSAVQSLTAVDDSTLHRKWTNFENDDIYAHPVAT